MSRRRAGLAVVAGLALSPAACVVPDHRFDTADAGPPIPATHALLDWTGDLTGPRFFDAPFPTLLRTVGGRPDWSGLPAMPTALGLDRALATATARTGTPLAPVLYVRWSGPLTPLNPTEATVIGQDAVYLIDIDPASPERGWRFPVVAQTLAADPMVPPDVLALTVAPGATLRPDTTYGILITNQLRDAAGVRVRLDPDLDAWRGGAPAVSAAAQMLAPLWEFVSPRVTLDGPAAALVFRTGDPLAVARARLDAAAALAPIAIDPATLTLVTDAAFVNPDLCELRGTVTMPQFQRGAPPFATDGDLGDAPTVQRTEAVAFTLAIPKRAMPAAGYPLVLTAPELGDYATSAVAPITVDGTAPDAEGRRWGAGLAFPFARAGVATASAARPQGPERLPAEVQRHPLRADNPAVIGGNVQQAALELRLLRAALADLAVPAGSLAGCLDPTLLGGAPAAIFDGGHVGLAGHGHGGAAALLAVATDPGFGALALTGARGGWTSLAADPGADGARAALAAALATPAASLTRLHPALAILEAAIEDADPLALATQVAVRAASGGPARPVLDAVVAEDATVAIADAAALARALQVPIAGAPLAPALTDLTQRGGLAAASYPVTAATPNGARAPSATIQSPPPAAPSPAHDAVYQRRPLRYQLTCFVATALTSTSAVVVAPVDRDDAFPCD